MTTEAVHPEAIQIGDVLVDPATGTSTVVERIERMIFVFVMHTPCWGALARFPHEFVTRQVAS